MNSMTEAVALALAQIIPVFLLAFIAESAWLTSRRAEPTDSRAKASLFVTSLMVIFVMVSEGILLDVANRGGLAAGAAYAWLAAFAILSMLVIATIWDMYLASRRH